MVDVLCTDDLDLYGRDIDDPLAELAQDVEHMLLESYGSNPDDVARSIGLTDALSGAVDSSLRHRIETSLVEDPRIEAAEVTITESDVGSSATYRIDLAIQVNGDVLGLAFDAIDGAVTRVAR